MSDFRRSSPTTAIESPRDAGSLPAARGRTGFLVFLLLGGGAATALWRLSLNRRVQGWGSGEGSAAPLVEPEAQAGSARAAGADAAARHAGTRRRTSPRPGAAAQRLHPEPRRLRLRLPRASFERRAARERRWSLPSNELDTCRTHRFRACHCRRRRPVRARSPLRRWARSSPRRRKENEEKPPALPRGGPR